MSKTYDIIIIGGGVIGCSIAFRLAEHGLSVAVVEKGRPGEEASRAAAGMLAPYADAFHAVPEPLRPLCFESLARYPDFVAQLQEETGVTIRYRTTGSFCVATDFAEAQMLAGLMERVTQAGGQAEELSPTALRRRLPTRTEAVELGLFLPGDHYVDPRDLMTALWAACVQRGVTFYLETPVQRLVCEGKRVTRVCTATEALQGETVVNAAGSWAGLLSAAPESQVPVRPIRGQIVCLEQRPQPLPTLVHAGGCYLVPWPDGRILVGATMENVGFDQSVTAEGVRSLLDAALKLLPGLQHASVVESWAGLRPGTPDDLPILGVGQVRNLVYATGHFRNGILLAPITADLIRELITSNQTAFSLTPFLPTRFAQSTGKSLA